MKRIGFWARLWLAIVVPWRLLFDSEFAARVAALRRSDAPAPSAVPQAVRESQLRAESELRAQRRIEPQRAAEPPQRAEPPRRAEPQPVRPTVTVAQSEPDPTPALQILAILQREGRLLDFLQEDVGAYGDADVGAAARVLHQGCKRAIAQYLELEAVRPEAEGAPITLPSGFDAARIRVTGNVVGAPPYSGRLAHHGWQVRKIRLPVLADGHDARIVAPAEVELP